LFERLRAKLNRALWVERSGGSLEYAATLLGVWPDARAIHLVRDGRAVAHSMAGHPYFRLKLARHLAGDESLSVAECLRAELPVDRFGAYWSALMLRSAALLRRDRGASLIVRYEALVAEPGRELGRIAAFLGVTAEPRWLAQAGCLAQQRAERWRELPEATRSRLERACLPGLRALERLEH
jgi:putative sulfotransferase